MRRYSAALLFLLLLFSGRAHAVLPPVPHASGPLWDDLSYRDAASVQASWRSMYPTSPVSVVSSGGGRALRMQCGFRGTKTERAAWDHAVSLDLAACRGLRFDIYCADPSPISYFSLYLRSGGGWYVATFGLSSRAGWNSVTVNRSDTTIEGTPAGWASIDTVRIAAWRGTDADTDFYVANLALTGTADSTIAVIRGESIAKLVPAETSAVCTFTKNVVGTLDGLGLPYTMMSDLDLTADRLKNKTIVVLPHNPRMPDTVADSLAQFAGSGGKLVVFYILPQKLEQLTGMSSGTYLSAKYPGNFASIRSTDGGLPGMPEITGQVSQNLMHVLPVEGKNRVAATWYTDKGESTHEPAILVSPNCVYMTHVLFNDDPIAKRKIVLSMLGQLDKGLWKKAVENSLRSVGRFGPYTNFTDASHGIRAAAKGSREALQSIAQADAEKRNAVRLSSAGEYSSAMSAAEEAQESALRSYCMVQQPKPGEHRAWWCHSALGVPGMSWDQAIKRLADNGFNAIMVNMMWGGVAYYNSTVLPIAADAKTQGDQLAECVAACRKYGVKCHVWMVDWNMGAYTPREFIDRMALENRIQMGYDGKPETGWLCPSNPENQQMMIDAMAEVASKYEIDGVHFDYIRYPDGDHCYCPGCRARFEAAIGKKIANWPSDTRNDPTIRQEWLDFRCGNITKVVAGVHDAVKKINPKLEISAAVFPNWSGARDGVGQDWKLWCEKGYLDFVCPMDYTANALQFETMIRQQLTWAGRTPCYPGIGESAWDGASAPITLIGQIGITRRLGTGGFTIFNYSSSEAARVVPLCGEGITRVQSKDR